MPAQVLTSKVTRNHVFVRSPTMTSTCKLTVMTLPHPVQSSHLNTRRPNTVRVDLHLRQDTRHLQHPHLPRILLPTKRLSRQVHNTITQMLHSVLHMLRVNTLRPQQHAQATSSPHVRLQNLQSLLHSRKRRTTNNITQIINHDSTSTQRSNNPRKLLHQQISRPNVPRDLPRSPLPLHAKTVNKPHPALLEKPAKTPAKHAHLRNHILPRPASSKIDPRSSI